MRSIIALGFVFSLFVHQAFANWVQTAGPVPGKVSAFASSGQRLYAAAYATGAFVSTNGGTSWTRTSSGVALTNVGSLVVLGNYLFAGSTSDGLHRSDDGGATWTRVNIGQLVNSVDVRVVVNGGTLLAATPVGLYTTSDSGATFTLNAPLGVVHVGAVASQGTVTVAATSKYGVVRSLDAGASWESAGIGIGSTSISALTISGTIMIAGGGDGACYVSLDSGSTWVGRNTGLDGSSVNAVAVNGSDIFAALASGTIVNSSVSGTAWTTVYSTSNATAANALHVFAGGIYAGTDAGALRSTDNGSHWDTVNSGLIISSVSKLAATSTALFALTDQGLFRSTDNGDRWDPVFLPAPDTPVVFDLYATPTSVLLGTAKAGVLRSTDNGATWRSDVGSRVTQFVTQGTDIFAVRTISYSGDVGIARSTDDGQTWIIAGDSGLPAHPAIRSFAANESRLFLGLYMDWVYTSADKGAHWSPANLGLPANALTLATIGTTVLAGTEKGLFRSTNNGASWAKLDTISNFPPMYSDGQNLFMANGGVSLSLDSGSTWRDRTDGISPGTVSSFLSANGYLFAGINGSGVCRIALSEILSAVNERGASEPVAPAVAVFPEPANDRLSIAWPPAGAGAAIDLYNVLGERFLHASADRSGMQSLDVRALQTGTYMLVIRGGSLSARKSISIVR